MTARLPKSASQMYILQTASGETLHTLKEALVELPYGWHPLQSWVFILGLDTLRVHNTSVDLKHYVLQTGDNEVQL
jgi:hypothetical protein